MSLVTCGRCGGERVRTSDGSRRCLPCRATARRERRKDPVAKARARAAGKAYYAGHLEEIRARDRARYSPEKDRTYRLRKNRGLTPQEFTLLSERQGHACAICGEKNPSRAFSVDHDHDCCPGKTSCRACVRGLLCNRCNRAIGLFKDDPSLLEASAKYLRSYLGGARP